MNSDSFIGRNVYIKQTLDVFIQLFSFGIQSAPKFITMIGPGGIGKTQIVMKINEEAKSAGLFVTGVIDLQATANRSELSLLSSLARSLGQENFSDYFEALVGYNATDDLDKSKQYNIAIQIFIENCKSLSMRAPVILILDTFETIQGFKMGTRLLDLLYQLGGRVGVLLASRKKISLPESPAAELYIEPFSLLESELLSKLLYRKRKIEYDLDEQTLKSIYHLARGYPILITLAIEWILENAHPEDIIHIPIEQFEREMVAHIRLLQELESVATLLMAVANRRFSVEIMAYLTDLSIDKCKEICSKLARFSFIKSREDQVLVLHDEMLRLINRYVDLPDTYKNEKRRLLVRVYYETIIPQVTDPQYRQILTAEKLYYQLFYDPIEAVTIFDKEISSAIESFEFDFCNLLFDEADRVPLSPELKRFVDLGRAELALKQYRSNEAQQMFEDLSMQFDPKIETEAFCRVLEGLAGSIISPCTLVKADPFTAAYYWNQSLRWCEQKGLWHRVPTILFQLGNTYVTAGEYSKAEATYSQALEISLKQNDVKSIARILEEMNRLYRLQQDVQKSFPLIEQSLSLRQSINDTKHLGLTYYYLGNTYRDLDRFDLATEYYQKAVTSFEDIGDNYNLCRVCCDISWMAFLRQEYQRCEEYSTKSQGIALQYQFGAAISENWHISYEMLMARGEKEMAYFCLDKALYFAKKYNNFYTILDCLNHDAQRAYAKNEFEKIPSILQEMLDLEIRGCGDSVFRGRATVVHGDAYYDQGKYKDALASWKDGFTIIALYGNSRTNVELFADILSQRKERFVHTLRILGADDTEALRNYWVQMGFKNTFPSFLELCDLAVQLD